MTAYGADTVSAGWTRAGSQAQKPQRIRRSWTLTDGVQTGYKQNYNWVDQFDTLGLGANVPIATGSGSDSLLALRPDSGQWVVLRVPYPLGFFARGLDGRIDDPDAGWKGRGLWANYGSNLNWHIEGGQGRRSSVIHFQLRPHPLAK